MSIQYSALRALDAWLVHIRYFSAILDRLPAYSSCELGLCFGFDNDGITWLVFPAKGTIGAIIIYYPEFRKNRNFTMCTVFINSD